MSKRTDRPAPPLPKRVWSQLGPVKVRLRKKLRPLSADAPVDVDDFGLYDPKTRTIQILSSLDPWQRWQALGHEWVHMVTFDAGLHNALTSEQIEQFCDLIGTAFAAELRNTEPSATTCAFSEHP